MRRFASSLVSSTASALVLLTLAACGKPADAPAAAAPAAPTAAPVAAAPADAVAQGAAGGEKKEADKKDAIDPLAHEGVPGLSDLFSKKKEGGGH